MEFRLSRGIRWSRGSFEEKPVGELCIANPEQSARIAVLRDRYQVRFELQMSEATSRNNYEYLDILDRSWMGAVLPTGGVLCDVGCASFWYAATLQCFFRPLRIIGVEIEGHRLLRDGRSRIDYAGGYLKGLPQAQFVVADYLSYEAPADLITAWFPFLLPEALLAWRLPLRLLAPDRLFRHIEHNLAPDGVLFMANHGLEEWQAAQSLCTAAGLQCLSYSAEIGPLSAHRLRPPVASWWRRG